MDFTRNIVNFLALVTIISFNLSKVFTSNHENFETNRSDPSIAKEERVEEPTTTRKYDPLFNGPTIPLKENDPPVKYPKTFVSNFSHLDVRIGKIIQINDYPDRFTYLAMTLDIGTSNITVVHNFKKQMEKKNLMNKCIPVLLNIRKKTFYGYKNEGRIPFVRKGVRAEVMEGPPGSEPGDYVFVPKYERDPIFEVDPKSKMYRSIMKHCRIDRKKIARYFQWPWVVSDKHIVIKGMVKTQTILQAPIIP